MKREHELRRQLGSLRMLGEAIRAMKSLSAHHLRLARAGLTSSRAYRDGIDHLLGSVGLDQVGAPASQVAVLVVAADLGLCDGYTQQLVAAALDERRRGPGPMYCVGRRAVVALRRAGVVVERTYDAVASVEGLPRMLLTLADDVLGDYLRGQFGALVVVSARFEGVGSFTPRATHVLPLRPAKGAGPPAATPYVSAASLARTVVREYLYSTLYELLLDAMASEHGTRLVATQSAEGWLDEQIHRLDRRLAGVRQEASTQEVLDVASGARVRRRASEGMW